MATNQSIDLPAMTAVELQDLLSAGRTTSEDLVHQYLDHIGKYNEHYRAVIHTAPTESALAVAKSLDLERTRGYTRGPLHGIPVIIKVTTNREGRLDAR